MHLYATDSNERTRVTVYLTVLSIVLAFGLNRVLVAFCLTVPWWLDAPAVMGFFGVLHTLFDRRIWKSALARKLALTKVPDFGGTWRATFTSSHTAFASSHDATVVIDQTWTKVCVALKGEHSDSVSVVAAIVMPRPGVVILTYQYQNEPHAQAASTMHAHRGTAWLEFSRSGETDILEGEYYSGRDRQNFGHIKLDRNLNSRN